MNKKFFGKIFILLLVVGLLFAVAPRQAQAATTVTTEQGLRDALLDTSVTEILLDADISLASTVYVAREGVTIDGGNHTITGPGTYHGLDVTANNVTIKNLTITGSAGHNLQFYRATGGVVTNVVLAKAGKSGMMVNGSTVTISGVTTTGNAWGGINVDQGSGVTDIPLLTVTNATNHTSPTTGITPAIWVDSGNASWVSAPEMYVVVPGGMLRFWDKAEYAAAPPVHNTTNGTFFDTIQAAIDATTTVDGDVIEVAAGTYNENVVINKAGLTLKSIGPVAETIIHPTGGGIAIDILQNLGTVTVDGFKVTGFTTCGICQRFTQATGTSPVIKNNIVEGELGDVHHGNCIQVTGSNSLVEDNIVGGAKYIGTGEYGATGILVYLGDNTIVRNNVVSEADIGIGVSGGGGWNYPDVKNVQIFANEVFDSEVGISVGMDASDTLIENNYIHDNETGLFEEFNLNYGPTGTVAKHNRIVDNDEQASVGSTDSTPIPGGHIFNAEENWWGNAAGPDVALINGAIDYIPWCGEEACTTLVYPPVKNATQGTYFNTIQAAVDTAADGDTIEVGPGTYVEQVSVNKKLTILGPNADKLGNATDRVAEATLIHPDGLSTWDGTTKILEHATLSIESSDVTIKGLKFTSPAYLQGHMPRSIRLPGTSIAISNVTIENNLFVDVNDAISGRGKGYTLNLVIKGNKHDGGEFVNSRVSHFVNVTMVQMDVLNNEVSNVFYGVYHNMYTTPEKAVGIGGTVSGNTFETSGVGVWQNDQTWNSAKWVYTNNTFTISPTTVWIDGPDTNDHFVHRPFIAGYDLDYKAFYLVNNNKAANFEFTHNIVNLSNSDEKRDDRVFIESDDPQGDDLTMVGHFHFNKITNYTVRSRYVRESKAILDTSKNWWGTADGGVLTTQPGVDNFIQWCADEDCTSFLPTDNTIVLEGTINVPGGIRIFYPGMNYYLKPGTVIQNDSPCFEVYADNVKIYTDYPGAAKCVPTNGSDGIWVDDGVQGLRIYNLEFDGTEQDTGSGIKFAGTTNNFQVYNNYFHDLDASGIVFVGKPTGTTMDVQGNLFKDLGTAAIVVPAGLDPDLNAEFNSWGAYAGTTLTDVDTEPYTHADFYMGYEGIIPLEKVAVENTIKYTVYGNLKNIMGADFTLKFPTDLLDAGTPVNLNTFAAAGPDMFIVNEAAGTIRFQGGSMTPISGENLPIFEVEFTGTAAGTGAISFDQTNDNFAMSPGYGPSLHVYAAGFVDREVEVFADTAAPTLTSWTPEPGNIYLAAGEDFVLTVDALDDNLFSLEIDHNITDLPEFTVYASETNVYGSTASETAFAAAGVTVTYDESTQTWVLTFNSDGTALAELLAKKDIVFYAVLHDQAGKTWGSMDPTTADNTFAYTIVLDNTAPTLESWTPAKGGTYMLTPTGDFVLTVDAADVNLAALEIDHSLESVLPEFWVHADEDDPYGGDGTAFATYGLEVTYDEATQTWTLTFKHDGLALNEILANNGITFYAVIHDLAGNTWGSMYTVTPDNTFAYTIYKQQPIARADGTGGAVVAVVAEDGNSIAFTGEVDWYPADPDLGRTSGHRIGVRLSAPELDFDTAAATFTFNGQPYNWAEVKDGDDYVLVYPKVTAENQTWVIVVTWGTGFSQTFTVSFVGTLGPVTAYTVDGEISMQGRGARNTEDVITLTGYGTDIFRADSLDNLGINYTLTDVVAGNYVITTNQPRYLNITANMNLSIALIGDRTLPALWLRGGNAYWTDNLIDGLDASQVGSDWGSIANPDGNVNFDEIVNIQDLALVGGNFDMTSATAYGNWLNP